jgi:hypothetical protein
MTFIKIVLDQNNQGAGEKCRELLAVQNRKTTMPNDIVVFGL